LPLLPNALVISVVVEEGRWSAGSKGERYFRAVGFEKASVHNKDRYLKVDS
jgi:hypothetical protein